MYLLNTYYAQNGKSNTVKILKNREFESLRPRIWREIAERKPRVRENRELGNREVGGISVLLELQLVINITLKLLVE